MDSTELFIPRRTRHDRARERRILERQWRRELREERFGTSTKVWC